MYEWEREALGIDTLGELSGAVRVSARVTPPVEDEAAWWISALYDVLRDDAFHPHLRRQAARGD